MDCGCITAPWFEKAFNQDVSKPSARRETHPNDRRRREFLHYKEGWAGISYGQDLRDGEFRFRDTYRQNQENEEYERMLSRVKQGAQLEFFPYCVSSGVWFDGYKQIGAAKSVSVDSNTLKTYGWEIAKIVTTEDVSGPSTGPMSTVKVEKSSLMIKFCNSPERQLVGLMMSRINLAKESIITTKSYDTEGDYEKRIAAYRQAALGYLSATDMWRVSALAQKNDLLIAMQGGSLPIVLRPTGSTSKTYRCIGYAAPVLGERLKRSYPVRRNVPVCFVMKTFVEYWNWALGIEEVLEREQNFDLV